MTEGHDGGRDRKRKKPQQHRSLPQSRFARQPPRQRGPFFFSHTRTHIPPAPSLPTCATPARDLIMNIRSKI